MYAICFDLDTETLKHQYHNPSWQNGDQDIVRVLERRGFDRQRGSVSFGNDQVDPVRCVPAIQDVARECPWFRADVVDVRMLRIEENTDLLPALQPLP
ncbi:virulence factor [Methylobacterium sp. 17Sr1-1]|nr:virulence factor [Methylobacterium sp. 17Sr1-1]